MNSGILQFSPRISCLPVIHGSGEFALVVRRLMLESSFDCVAVPLPPSFQMLVERGIELLPTPTLVSQPEPPQFVTEWSPRGDADEFEDAYTSVVSGLGFPASVTRVDDDEVLVAHGSSPDVLRRTVEAAGD